MFHVALTPNTSPTNALSARHETLMGAIAQLLADLGLAYGPEEWFVSNVLEAMKEAVDNLEDGSQPAQGSWSDMGCEDDAFSIDIFCEDDAKYVLCDDHELLAPHGAIALVNGKLTTAWVYDEAELADWKKENEEHPSDAVAILIPAKRPSAGQEYNAGCDSCGTLDRVEGSNLCQHCGRVQRCEHTGMTNDYLEATCGPDNATITELIRDIKDGDCALSAIFSDGTERKLFSFYMDELSFNKDDLVGKTEMESHTLHQQRMVAFLQS